MQKTKRVKNPGKQRKRLFNAPAHIRHRLMSAPLSSELAASRGAKTLPVRKGDTVRIMRGDNKGFEGKVSEIDKERGKIKVLVNMFGRDTPVELDSLQIKKVQ